MKTRLATTWSTTSKSSIDAAASFGMHKTTWGNPYILILLFVMTPERVADILSARETVHMRFEDSRRAANAFVAAAEARALVPPRKGARQNSRRRRKSEASKCDRAMAKAAVELERAVTLENEARLKLSHVGVTFHDIEDDDITIMKEWEFVRPGQCGEMEMEMEIKKDIE